MLPHDFFLIGACERLLGRLRPVAAEPEGVQPLLDLAADRPVAVEDYGTTADDQGRFTFADVPPGTYAVLAERELAYSMAEMVLTSASRSPTRS